jgi:hypothetical protein
MDDLKDPFWVELAIDRLFVSDVMWLVVLCLVGALVAWWWYKCQMDPVGLPVAVDRAAAKTLRLRGGRVSFVGVTGSGKSTAGAALALRLGCDVIELDGLQWVAGEQWRSRSAEEVGALARAAVERSERWVAVGNQRGARAAVWGAASDVIWVDPWLSRNALQLARRCVHRWWNWRACVGRSGVNMDAHYDMVNT